MEEAKNKEKKTEKANEKDKEKEKGQQPSAKDKDKKEEQELVSLWVFSFNYMLTILPKSLLFCLSHCRFDNMVEQAKFSVAKAWICKGFREDLFLIQGIVFY